MTLNAIRMRKDHKKLTVGSGSGEQFPHLHMSLAGLQELLHCMAWPQPLAEWVQLTFMLGNISGSTRCHAAMIALKRCNFLLRVTSSMSCTSVVSRQWPVAAHLQKLNAHRCKHAEHIGSPSCSTRQLKCLHC